MCACMLSHVWLFVTPWTGACQAPLSMEFSRQKYWSGFPFPSPEDLPSPGMEPASHALASRFFTTSATWETINKCLALNYGGIHQLKLKYTFYKLLCEEYTKEEIYVGFLLEVYSKEYYGNTEYTYLCSFLVILECAGNWQY